MKSKHYSDYSFLLSSSPLFYLRLLKFWLLISFFLLFLSTQLSTHGHRGRGKLSIAKIWGSSKGHLLSELCKYKGKIGLNFAVIKFFCQKFDLHSVGCNIFLEPHPTFLMPEKYLLLSLLKCQADDPWWCPCLTPSFPSPQETPSSSLCSFLASTSLCVVSYLSPYCVLSLSLSLSLSLPPSLHLHNLSSSKCGFRH